MLKKLPVFIVQTLAVLVLTMVFGEVYVRAFHKVDDITPALLKERSLDYEPSVFARHVFPQKEQAVTHRGWLAANTPREYRINALGYRGVDFSADKPKGTVRIMIYGGSHVFDPGASNGEDWPSRIEQAFHTDGRKDVHVINAGIPGHASFDSAGRYLAEGHHFQPDYVILNNAWNDIKRLYSENYLLRDIKPLKPESNPLLSYQNPVDRLLGGISLFYVWLRQGYLFKKHDIRMEGAAQKLTSIATEPTALALTQYELTLQTFVDTVRNTGGVPILMIQPRLFYQSQRDTEEDQRYYEQRLKENTGMYPRQYILNCFAQLDDITRRVAAAKHVALIDPNEALRERPGERLFRDHVHLDLEGSRRLGRFMKEELTKIMAAPAGGRP
ncbi:MAG: SGNH/GDSL hydrolase family protein [Candidatus Omnitrophica bacterium]|nr:SGNH/GDSL hydrolase family protein [Candidatus Omnitrophota bacterium]